MSVLDRRQHRNDAADLAVIDGIVAAWRDSCIGCGLALQVDGAIAGTSFRTPTIEEVRLGPPTVLQVALLPGTAPEAITAVGRLVAPFLGGRMLRVEPLGFGERARVTVLREDPLAGVLPLRLPRSGGDVLLGRDEGGREIVEDWRKSAHSVIQGVTRSGKSVLTYGILAQFAGMNDVTIGGVDPTGLLFRPFVGTRHAEWQVSGVGDPAAVERVLQRHCEEMDQRIRDLPLDRDTMQITAGQPMRVVILEELAGLYRSVDIQDKDCGKRIRALIGRLLAEGAKVGYRVIILVQRAEAAVIDAFARAMCSLRISFRVDNYASVELLHPGADKALAEVHTSALPGIALLSVPGYGLRRMRAPLFDGGYASYTAAIASACRDDFTA